MQLLDALKGATKRTIKKPTLHSVFFPRLIRKIERIVMRSFVVSKRTICRAATVVPTSLVLGD